MIRLFGTTLGQILVLVIVAILWKSAVAFSPVHVLPSVSQRRHHYQSFRHRGLASSSSCSSSSSSSDTTTNTEEDLPGVKYLATIRQEISDHLESWDSCVELVVRATGMDRVEAELRLAEATRWKAWAIVTSELARKYIQTTIPTIDKMNQTLDWLQQSGPLQLTPDQLQTAIRNYPETYLNDPATKYKRALNVAPREWRGENQKDFDQLVRDQPRAMSLTYNCVDDGCQAECGNCWVTFRNSS